MPPEPDTVVAPAVSQYNATNPSQPIELRFVSGTPGDGVIVPIVLSLLPVLLIGGFFYFLMGARRKP